MFVLILTAKPKSQKFTLSTLLIKGLHFHIKPVLIGSSYFRAKNQVCGSTTFISGVIQVRH